MIPLLPGFDIQKYSIEDFKEAIEVFKRTKDFVLKHPPLVLCVETLTRAIADYIGEDIPKEDVMRAMFANGLVLGLIAAENKQKESTSDEQNFDYPENRTLH